MGGNGNCRPFHLTFKRKGQRLNLPSAPTSESQPPTSLSAALLPIGFLVGLIGYGLIARPLWLDQPAIPLEIIFVLAAAFTVLQLMIMGHQWSEIQKSIVAKFIKAIPAFLILFSIGLVIASWIVCGTIPMLVYYGLKTINPNYLYILAFLAPIIFSTLTGTSWGSVGTIGVVLIGIAKAIDANMGITAGAIIGGAYFGDKLSPLSDTTNLASLACDVDLFEHIQSMMYTTIPSALIAAAIYLAMGFVDPPEIGLGGETSLEPFLAGLETIFDFNFLLLLPPLIVLIGSVRRMPTVPVLLTSVFVACGLALVFQKFSFTNVIQSVYKGFSVEMATWVTDLPQEISVLLDRGGLYALNDAIITAFMVFVFIGTLDHIRAMPTVVERMLGIVQSQSGTVISSLFATACTNALTSNQFATSFIIGDAFKSKYDQAGVPRKVLSRSLEDTGTMLETIIPWTTSALFMVATLNVPFDQYFRWQLMSLINIPVAVVLALTGIGCFYSRPNIDQAKQSLSASKVGTDNQ